MVSVLFRLDAEPGIIPLGLVRSVLGESVVGLNFNRVIVFIPLAPAACGIVGVVPIPAHAMPVPDEGDIFGLLVTPLISGPSLLLLDSLSLPL